VAKSGGDYSTLAEAIAAANDSAANPVTIELYPGVYNEHITLLNRYISIIGVNRDTCIIRDDSGRYNNDPIKISGGKWRLENLSLISTHSKAGSWTPSWVFPDLPSYALHIDNGSAGGEGIVENCYLYCENLNAIGAGTHNGEKIQIINCEIVRNTTDANYVSSDYKGAVACHSPNIYDDSETASEFSMYNCNITCNLDEALQLKALAATSKMKSTMVGNTLVANNKVTNVVAFAGSFTTKNDYIKIQSHGNSTSELNAIE
jgi:pectin methylesterase-like acyl-CoA thioesterase